MKATFSEFARRLPIAIAEALAAVACGSIALNISHDVFVGLLVTALVARVLRTIEVTLLGVWNNNLEAKKGE